MRHVYLRKEQRGAGALEGSAKITRSVKKVTVSSCSPPHRSQAQQPGCLQQDGAGVPRTPNATFLKLNDTRARKPLKERSLF